MSLSEPLDAPLLSSATDLLSLASFDLTSPVQTIHTLPSLPNNLYRAWRRYRR